MSNAFCKSPNIPHPIKYHIPHPIKNLGFEEKKVTQALHKCHRLGKASHKYTIQISLELPSMQAETTYKTRKNLKSLSLAKHRTKIINYAHRITGSVPEVKFAYADVNDNLKIRLHEQREGKYTFPFNSHDSLHNIFRKFGWSLPNNDGSDDDDV